MTAMFAFRLGYVRLGWTRLGSLSVLSKGFALCNNPAGDGRCHSRIRLTQFGCSEYRSHLSRFLHTRAILILLRQL